MNCRHCQCPVATNEDFDDDFWYHNCVEGGTHVLHNHRAEPDKRINTQPIKGEK